MSHALTIGSNQPKLQVSVDPSGFERRQHRRHDLEQEGIEVHRWDGGLRMPTRLGRLIDLSAGGVRLRTEQADIRPDAHIRVRLELPAYAGISPFVDHSGPQLRPKREWVGWLSVTRVENAEGGHVDVAGRLVDMDEIDRGMLGLYLSTHPLAA